MLPPVDPDILSTNPQFEALYTDLCAKRIDGDGTSRLDAKAVKERDAISEVRLPSIVRISACSILKCARAREDKTLSGLELRKAKLESAKRDIMRHALQDLAYGSEEVSDEIRELAAVVAAAQSGEIADEDAEILEEVIEKYKEKSIPIASHLSKRFTQDIQIFSGLANPSSAEEKADTTTIITTLQTEIADAQEQITTSRLALAGSMTSIHALSRQVLETSIRLLEQTIHGSMTRNVKARAEYLATVAEGMAKKLAVQHQQLLQQAYSVDMTQVLKMEAEEMEKEHVSLKRQIREAEEELEKYGKLQGLEKLADEYAQILDDVERTRKEVARLEES